MARCLTAAGVRHSLAGYTVEEEIHHGPYNKIQGWDYTALVRPSWPAPRPSSQPCLCLEERHRTAAFRFSTAAGAVAAVTWPADCMR